MNGRREDVDVEGAPRCGQAEPEGGEGEDTDDDGEAAAAAVGGVAHDGVWVVGERLSMMS